MGEIGEQNMTIRQVEEGEEKKEIARTILEQLLDWFSIPEGREKYINESADQLFFAAVREEQPIGFLCLKETGKDTVEIAVMGVLEPYHQRGIGTELVNAAKVCALQKGYSFLQVKTVQMGHYDDYDKTNRFYQRLGFKEFEVFPALWDESNPCQIYVMKLEEDGEERWKRYFFVDYENVNRKGLDGIGELSEDDCVKIYYSSAAESLTFDLHKNINESRAFFEYIKVQMPIKNAADCLMLFDIIELARKNRNAEYFIVSKDTDFDHPIEDFTSRNLKVRRVLQIGKLEEVVHKTQEKSKAQSSEKLASEEKRAAQIRTFFGQHFKKKIYTEKKEEIIRLILDSKTKQQINNGLMKLYPSEMVSEIYKRLNPLIKNLPGK